VKRSNRLLVLFGLLFALVGGGLAFVVASGPSGSGTAAASPTPTPEPTTTVVVAKQDINDGERITEGMIEAKPVKISERAALGPDTFTTVSEVVGKVAGGKISTGEPLLGSRDFLTPGSVTDGKDIASAIASGYLAVSIELDQINGVGTLIVPGDRINIILSVYVNQIALKNSVDKGTNKLDVSVEGGKDVTTKMIIQNRRVLRTLLPPLIATPTTAPVANASPAPIAAPTTPIVRNDSRHMVAIVEVTPDEAEVISWAQREEKGDPQNYIDLSVALRSDQDNALPKAQTPGITYRILVDKYQVLPPDPRADIPADLAKELTW
jgi:Flp pilus assembly protein CpaB